MAEDHTTCEVCGPSIPKVNAVVLDRRVRLIECSMGDNRRVTFGALVEKNRTLCKTHLVEDAADPRSEAEILTTGPRIARDFGTQPA